MLDAGLCQHQVMVVVAGSLEGVSVLVVEDHPDMREVLQTWLEMAGATVTSARDGAQALKQLASGPAPEVILCDLHMPRMDGCEFLTRLREQVGFGRIPAIAVTGNESEDALLRTLEAGFTAHLIKPVTGNALRAQIKRVLGR